MNNSTGLSRRSFLRNVAIAGVVAQALPLAGARAQGAARKLKVALIGCGGRGSGALDNCHEAAKIAGVELEVVAVADVFQDRANGQGGKYNVPADRRFVGFDAYHKVLEQPGLELVLLATSPNFRPLHLEAAIAAGKNVFMEKPVAVDPPGVRRVLAAGAAAKTKNLCIVAGTQRRHEKGYRRNAKAIEAGAIGRIVGGTVSWCGGALWYKTRDANEDDAHYMVRNWTSFTEMSGDHIVEQHVHNLDVAQWFIGRTPVAVLGFGGRARRKTGDQFDFFSLDLDYGSDCHLHSMCRQVNGCDGGVGEFFVGTEGVCYGGGALQAAGDKKIELADVPGHDNPYVQEHVDLLEAIVKGTPTNEAENVAHATMAAIMGRISAYTGKQIRWTEVMQNEQSPFFNVKLAPAADDFEKGPVVAPKDDVFAVPGQPSA